MSQRLTDPIYDSAKVYRRLRTFKKTGDDIIAFAVVQQNGKYGVVDPKGNVLVPLSYESVESPIFIDEYEKEAKDKSNVFFKVKAADGKNQVIDISNNIIFDGTIPADLYKELAKAEKKNNKDKARAQQTEANVSALSQVYYDLITKPLNTSSEAMAACNPIGSTVFVERGLYGVKDSNGNVVIPAIFDNISKFNEKGVASVIINDIPGYINEHGFIAMPFEILTFPGLIAPYEKTMNKFNVAFDVYPTNTYAWLAAADYLMNSSFVTIQGGSRNYAAALQCYDMALAMAKDRDEMYYFSKRNLEDRDKAYSYAKGLASPVEDKIEKSGWALAADIFNSIANFTSTLNTINSGGTSYEYLDSGYGDTPQSTGTSGNSKSKGNSVSSNRHGSVSEATAMHADDRTYCNYETQLIKMKSGNDDYKDSRRRDIQSKMKKIRKKWEGRGYNFYHSEMEDWGGK